MEISEISIKKIGLTSLEPSKEDYRECGKSIFEAFSRIGFAFIRHHGIEDSTVEKVFEKSREFFALPVESKKLVRNLKGSDEGYVARGQEIFDASEDAEKASDEIREAFDIKSLDPEGIFPEKEVPGFKESMTSLAHQSKTLAFRVLKSLALSLGQDKDFFTRHHTKIFKEGGSCIFRTLFYPSVSDDDVKIPGIVRCGTHSDYGCLTFLFQDQSGGLEVQAVDKTWIQATPVKGCILINVGDLMERFTNGLFPATRHRVKIPKDVTSRSLPRQSIAFFVEPDSDTEVVPLAGLNGEPRFEPVNAGEYLTSRFEATYQKNNS